MVKESKIAKKEIIFLLLLIVGALFLRLRFMGEPFDRDEGAYAYVASRMAHSELPYRDVFDHKPPFIYHLYKAAFDIFGQTDAAVRLFTSIYVIFTMLLVYMFTRTFAGAAAAMLAALFYCLFQNTGLIEGYGSNTEVFTQFTALFAVFFLLDRDKTYEKANFFLSGFFMAAAFLTKTMLVFACAAPVIYMLYFIRGNRNKLSAILWYGAGFLLMLLLAVLWAVKNGMLNEFLESNINYNVFYVALRERTVGAGSMLGVMAAIAGGSVLMAAALLYSAAGLYFKKTCQVNFMMFMMAATVLAGIILLKGVYQHYYAALVPFLAVSAAYMAKDAFLAAMKMKKGAAAATAVVFALFLAGTLQAGIGTYAYGNGQTESEQELWGEARVIGGEIKKTADKNASVFVWANEPEIYFYSGLKARGRFMNAYPYGYYRDAFSQLYSRLAEMPPEYFVIQKGQDEKVFEKLLKTYYSKSLEGEMLVLYKRSR